MLKQCTFVHSVLLAATVADLQSGEEELLPARAKADKASFAPYIFYLQSQIYCCENADFAQEKKRPLSPLSHFLFQIRYFSKF